MLNLSYSNRISLLLFAAQKALFGAFSLTLSIQGVIEPVPSIQNTISTFFEGICEPIPNIIFSP